VGQTRKQRILIVEDDGILGEILLELLSGFGYEVIGPASDLERAQKMLARERPDAAMLDVHLGGTTVFPIAEYCAEQSIPFVFLTGYSDTSMIPAKFRDRPRIGKPFDPNSIALSLEALVGRPPD
jgi:DNA-binding response OmpR family regulator